MQGLTSTLQANKPLQSTNMEQAERLWDQLNGCSVKTKERPIAIHLYKRLYEPLSSRTVERADLYEGLVMSLNWKQLSAEGHVALYQAFAHFKEAVLEALGELKPGEKLAVVLDLDDGTIESTPYFGNLPGTNFKMAGDRSLGWWKAQPKCSYALPGVANILNSLKDNPSIQLYYLTSRGRLEGIHQVTKDMLNHFGFPGVTNDSVKIATESNPKGKQLKEIFQDCEKSVLLGDKLGDLGIPESKLTEDQLREEVLSERQRPHLGVNKIVIPNPVYGPSWEKITHTPFSRTEAEEAEYRKNKLKRWDDTGNTSPAQWNPFNNQLEQALHYVQSSTYDVLTIQTCQRAAKAFNKLSESQASEQQAAVVYLEGCALDSSPWVAGLCANQQQASQESLNRWALSKQAKAVEGIHDLVKAYREKGVLVVWMSRATAGKESTGNNVQKSITEHLQALGLFADGDQVLLKDDDSAKQALKKKKIIQIVGSGLADLEIEAKPFFDVDSSKWPEVTQEIGSKRVLVPNPAHYDGWHSQLKSHLQGGGQSPVADAVFNRLNIKKWRPDSETSYLNLMV